MNCSDIDEFLDDFLGEALSPLAIVAFEQHIAKCSNCKSKVAEAKAIQTEMRDIAVPEPSYGFEQRVFENVRKHYKEESNWHFSPRFAAGFASLSAVSLAIWLVIGQQPPLSPKSPQVVSIALNQTYPVRLMFDADRAITQAELSISLPDNVELKGFPGHRELKWKTNLKKGQNILALPIKATSFGQGEIHTQLSYNNSIKHHDFLLNAAETPSSVQLDTKKLIHKF